MKIKIITDSASNLDKTLLDKYDIDMVSLSYEVDGKIKPCYDPRISCNDLGKEFYNYLREGKSLRTSLVSPKIYYDLFKKYINEGNQIIYISFSSKLSGTYNSSTTARDMILDEFKDAKITCIDTLSASLGVGIIAMEAAKLAQNNVNFDEIVKKIEELKFKVRSEFTVDNLLHLKKGGRISSFSATIGDLLDIKPLLTVSKKGTLELASKVKGRKRALTKLAETVEATIKNPKEQTLYITHGDCLEEAEDFKQMILDLIPDIKDTYLTMNDFCTGGHSGPGTLAVFYIGEERQ